MTNVPAPAADPLSLTNLVAEHADDLATYATHLIGDADTALEYVAGGLQHARKYPPLRIHENGRAALYRAVTRACRNQEAFPPKPAGLARFFKRSEAPLVTEFEGRDQARRINTVKRALMTIAFERRAALLLRDLAHLTYREMAIVLEASPTAVARNLAAARRDFGSIYREIAL